MGFKTLPIKPGTKEPSCAHGVKDATGSDLETDSWYRAHPDDGIGIAGDGLVIFDFDIHEGVDGRDALIGWDLPDTLCQTTPSGGYHMIYRTDREVRPSVNSELAVDVRGWHSYIVCDPTPGYCFEEMREPADADGAVYSFLDCIRPRTAGATKTRGLGRPRVNRKVKEGGRNDYLYRKGCSLRATLPDDDNLLISSLEVANRMDCDPPLEDAELQKLIGSVLTLPPGLSEEAEDEKEKAGKKRGRPRKFEHNVVAKALIEEHGACMLDGMPAVREDGKRYMVGWDAIDAAIIEMNDECTSGNRKEVKEYIKARAPHRTQSPADLMAFTNGVLDLRTMELRDWREDDAIPNVIPHRWNPSAASPMLDRMLERMACGDIGTLLNLTEFIGICMARSSRRYPFFPVLIGEGSNGKSTYISLLKDVLGLDNISSLQPHEISARFMASHIVGKTANLGDDIASGWLDAQSCAVIKSIATGDLMFTDVKGGRGFEFEPYCTMVFSCNQFPRLADTSPGFMRRLFPVEFNATFSKADDDYDPLISEKLRDEETLEHACVIGVEGLQRVIAQNSPTPNPMSESMKGEIAREANTGLQWFNDEGVTAEHLIGMTKAEVYDEYYEWAQRNGYAKTALGSGTLAALIGTYYRLSCSKTGHREFAGTRKTVREFEYRVPKVPERAT